MKNNVVILVAQMSARPGMEKQTAEELQKLVAPTLKEDGCIMYDLHVSEENPGEFMFYEIWRDRESLKRHSESVHLTEFRKIRESFLSAPPRLTFYSRI